MTTNPAFTTASLVLFPTDIADQPCLNILQFISWDKESSGGDLKWSHVLDNKAKWYDGLQEEFENRVEQYWMANNLEEGFFPGGAIKIAFAEKMQRQLVAKQDAGGAGQDLSRVTDRKAALAAQRVVDSLNEQIVIQKRKVDICKAQASQSEAKLTDLEVKLLKATTRLEEFTATGADSF